MCILNFHKNISKNLHEKGRVVRIYTRVTGSLEREASVRPKRMLHESSAYQTHLKKPTSNGKCETMIKMDKHKALEKRNLDSAKKFVRQVNKSINYSTRKYNAETRSSLKLRFEENQETCRQMVNSYLAQADTMQKS